MLNLQTLLSIAHWISPRLKLDKSGKYFELISKFGQPAEFSMPIEILSLGIKMFSRGLYTMLVHQTKTDWKWPYWLRRQSDPNDIAFQPVAHLIISQNRIFRNWTLLGLPNDDKRMTVDSAMMMMPFQDGYAIEFWLEVNGKIICIGDENSDEVSQTKYLDSHFPQIRKQSVYCNRFSVRQDIFVSSFSGHSAGFTRLKIMNLTSDIQKAKLFVCIRPYNVEGISPVHHVKFDGENKVWFVDQKSALFLNQHPDKNLTGSDSTGDIWKRTSNSRQSHSVSCEKGLAHSASIYQLEIQPKSIEHFDFVVPMMSDDERSFVDWKDSIVLDYDRAKRRFEHKWSRTISDKMKITLPDDDLQNLTNRCIQYQSIFAQKHTIAPGFFIYSDFWFRDAAYLLFVMLKSGHFQIVREIIKSFPERQNSDGFFESQEGEWDSNGEALWITGQYFRFTNDRELIVSLWPNLIKGARWIQKKRLSNNADKDVTGLLPAGFSAEHFGQNDYYFWDNFWSIAGYKELLNLAHELKKTKDILWLEKELELYTTNLTTVMDANISNNADLITASPKRNYDAGAIGVLSALSPLQILEKYHPNFMKTADRLMSDFMVQNCYYHPVAHTGINIYLTLHLRHSQLVRHDDEFWSNMRSVAALAAPTGTWPEGIHPQLKSGVMGEGHHGWANSEWINNVRDSFVNEKNDELEICSVYDKKWFENDCQVAIENTYSTFGKISFTLSIEKRHLLLDWQPEFTTSPKQIRWFMPKNVRVNSAYFTDRHGNNYVVLSPTPTKMQISISTLPSQTIS